MLYVSRVKATVLAKSRVERGDLRVMCSPLTAAPGWQHAGCMKCGWPHAMPLCWCSFTAWLGSNDPRASSLLSAATPCGRACASQGQCSIHTVVNHHTTAACEQRSPAAHPALCSPFSSPLPCGVMATPGGLMMACDSEAKRCPPQKQSLGIECR